MIERTEAALAAEWWELAIPAGATLGGVAFTVAGAMVTGVVQRRHERRSRFLEDRRNAYIKFRAIARDLRRKVKRTEEIRKEIEEITDRIGRERTRGREIQANIKIFEEEIAAAARMLETESGDGGERKDQLASRLTSSRDGLAKAKAELEREKHQSQVLDEELDRLADELSALGSESRSSQQDFDEAESIVAYLGTKETRVAAATLLRMIEADDLEFARVDEAFAQAVRRDLGV
ncbi:hypothetical protein [Micromonospora sp. NPDC093277]|uniref:hypothetical protein n=1 Tax=Micromonospora sp. NPDC093277 TaxID=3364291 RepID=UPI00381AD7A0